MQQNLWMIYAYPLEIGLKNYQVIEYINTVYGSIVNGEYVLNGEMGMLSRLKS